MFYLNLWKMIFKKHMVGKILLGLLFVGFIPFTSSLKLVKNTKIENPYFHVLFQESEQTSSINTKLKDIPGIVSIARIPAESIKKKLRLSLDAESGSMMNEIDFDYSGLTISISQELKGKAKELLKKYIKKMAGDDVEISQVFQPKEQTFSQLGILADIRIQLSILFIFWLFMVTMFAKQERNFLYLSRQFHRGRAVGLKTYLFNFLIYMGIFCVSFLVIHQLKFNQELFIFILACGLVGVLPYSQKLKWQM